MALGLERLLLVIDAEYKGAVAGINATGAAATSSLGTVSAQSKAASTSLVAVGAAGVIAGGLAAKGLSSAVDSVNTIGREVLKVQRLTGDSAEDASKLRFAAQQSGVPIDKLATSLSILSSKGSELGKIGVALKDADGAARPFNDVLGDIGQKIASLPAGQQRVDLARDLFGRGGADLLPLLSRGRDGIEALEKAAEDFGNVLTQDTLDSLKRNIVATREWDATWQGLKLQVGSEVLPAVTGVAEAATTVGKAISDIPGLGSLVTDLAVAGAGIGIVGGGATLLAAGATKVKSTWAQLPEVFGRSAAATTEDTGAKLANAEASNLAAAAADRLAAAERLAASASAASGEAAAAAGVAKGAGAAAGGAAAGGGLLAGAGSKLLAVGSVVGGVGLAVGAGVVASNAILDVVNSVRGVDEKLSGEYERIAETSKKGGKEAVAAFVKAAREEEGNLSASGALHVGESIFGRFQLGGPGKSVSATYANKTFKNVLSSQGPDTARQVVDSLKAVNDEQDHTSDSYKQTNTLIKEWTRLVDNASAAQKINGGITDDQADKVDRLGHVYDSTKSAVTNWAEGFSDVLGIASSAVAASQAVADAQQKLADDDAKIAKLGGGPANTNAADSSDKIASAQRGEAAASAALAATGRDLAAAKAELARIDQASDPERYAAAERSVADATEARTSATEALASAQSQASSAQAAAISQANDLADAQDRIASATRSQAAAQRELQNANRDLAAKRAELAHVNQAKDPNRYRQLSGEVADLEDTQAGARDRVADADASQRQAERELIGLHAEAKAKNDELAQSERDRAKDSDALALSVADQALAFLKLGEYAKANPEAIPEVEKALKDWAAQAGGDAPAAAQRFIDKLDAITAHTGETTAAVQGLIDTTKTFFGLGPLAAAGVENRPGGALHAPTFSDFFSGGLTAPKAKQSLGDGTNGSSTNLGVGGLDGNTPKTVGPVNTSIGYLYGLPTTGKANGSTARDKYGRVWKLSGSSWIPQFADGGMIGGVGNEDSELIMAMPGEFVVRKNMVAKYGAGFMEQLNAGSLPKYANGGFVGPIPGKDFGTATGTTSGNVETLLAQAVQRLDEAVALLSRTGDIHVNLDQRGYERPPGPADTARGVRSGMHLAGR